MVIEGRRAATRVELLTTVEIGPLLAIPFCVEEKATKKIALRVFFDTCHLWG